MSVKMENHCTKPRVQKDGRKAGALKRSRRERALSYLQLEAKVLTLQEALKESNRRELALRKRLGLTT